MPRKKYIVELTSEEREQLKQIIRKGKARAYKIKHANILLKADVNGQGLSDDKIADMFGCHMNTVAGVRQRFVELGLEAALACKKRSTPPVPKLLDGRKEAKLIALACSKPPQGRANWTLRLLADEMVALEVVETISYETVRRTLKKMSSSRTYANAG